MSSPRIAVGPRQGSFATDAVRDAGGTVVDIADKPDAIVWLDPADVAGLAAWLSEAPDVRWVQLPFAGVEPVAEYGMTSGITDKFVDSATNASDKLSGR